MNKQIFTTVLLWALAQAYLIVGAGFVANSFVFSEWFGATRYLLFVSSTAITLGFVYLFTTRK